MDKKALRARIRSLKEAMTPGEIEEKSARLGQLFAASPAYAQAKTIYGYLPYNQEVRTVPMLEQALREGKRVAVPKCFGDEMQGQGDGWNATIADGVRNQHLLDAIIAADAEGCWKNL